MNFNLHPERYNYRDLMIFIVPLMIFSMYLFIFNPGILTVESFGQLHQIATGKFSSSYPVFHTLIEMIFLKIGGSPLIMGIVQILVFSAIWTFICKYHRDDAAGSSDHFVLQAILTVIISIIPLNAVNSITLSNYVLFSYSLMFLCFLIKVMIDRGGEIDNGFIATMAVTMALVAGFSNYGGYVALISLILIIVYLFKKNVDQNTFIRLAAVSIALILLITVLSFAIAGDDGPDVRSEDDKIDLQGAKAQFFSSINDTPKASFEDVEAANLGNGNYNMVNSFVNAFKDDSILNLIFNNPIIYLMLTVLLFVFLQSVNRLDDLYMVYVPAFVNTAIAFIASPAQFNLCLYSNQLAFYLLVLILISMWINDNNILSMPQTLQKSESNRGRTNTINENVHIVNQEPARDIESEIDNLSMDEINEMISETSIEEEITELPTSTPSSEESEEELSSDLIDEILKEIER